MGHHHHHGRASANIGIAFLMNLFFALAEVVGGLWTGSVAILADAVHDFGDALTLGIAYLLQKLSERGRSRAFSYGYGRLSLLSALITGFVLLIGAAFVLYEAVPRLHATDVPRSGGMMAFAILGIAVNGVAAVRLRGGATHSERLLTWHMVEDLLGWVAVLVGGAVIHFTGWAWVDPALAIGIAVFILVNVLRNLWDTSHIFMQGVPADFREADFRDSVRALEGVADVHDIHAWSLDGERNILSLHVVVHDTARAVAIKSSVRELAARYGRFHTTVEVESRADACGDVCDEHHDHGH